MGRRGHSTAIGKFAKLEHSRRVSEIRVLGETLRAETRARADGQPMPESSVPAPAGAGARMSRARLS